LALAPGTSSFTSFLIQGLKELSTGPPFSTVQLHEKLIMRVAQRSAQSGKANPTTPIYWRLSRSKLRQSILLQSYRKPADKTPTHKTMPEQDTIAKSTSSRVLLSIRLNEDHKVNLRDWKAWLNNIPDNIESINIETKSDIGTADAGRKRALTMN
jgi:hypothetical protein